MQKIQVKLPGRILYYLCFVLPDTLLRPAPLSGSRVARRGSPRPGRPDRVAQTGVAGFSRRSISKPDKIL